MKHVYQYAYAARWILLVLGLMCVLAAGTLYVMAADADPIALAILAAFFITQWLFLLPRRGWNLRLAERGRPMKFSIVAGALISGFVSFGLFMTMWELFVERGSFYISGVVCWSVIAAMWLLWTIVFYVRWRSRTISRYSALSSVVRWMLTGTIAELLVASPVFAFVDDPDNCYCARGSFYGLFIGIAAMLWVFGPGILLLFLQERQRRLSSPSLCLKCGYDLRGTLKAGRNSCPECGATATRSPTTR